MANQTPFIDSHGNMHLHAREGGMAVFEFQNRDMRTASVFFETRSKRIQLIPGDSAAELILSIPRGAFPDLLNKSSDYIIVDETGEVPHVIMEAKLIVSGWM